MKIEFMFAHLPESQKIVKMVQKFFYEILPGEISEKRIKQPSHRNLTDWQEASEKHNSR